MRNTRNTAIALGLLYLAAMTAACTTREAVIGTGALAAGAAVGYIASDEGVGHDHDDHHDRDHR